MSESKRRGLGRREMLQLGIAGTIGLGTGRVSAAALQAPGTGQGPQPPRPEDIVDVGSLIFEDWTEPWVWRPSDWPGQSLDLHVVGNAHPPRAASTGNPFVPLFSFNGSSPAPTIRMRGNEVLRITVRNMLGRNHGVIPIGPTPAIFDLPPEKLLGALCRIAAFAGVACDPAPVGPIPIQILADNFDEFFRDIPVDFIENALLSMPANNFHSSHTTNLHTHGLHTEPGMNPNGTAGDNIFLRVIPRADLEYRQQADDPQFRQLSENERVGELAFEHSPGDVQRARRIAGGGAAQPHPPGTHWYHPHAHGSTQDQIASGMAGFLIVEGDVDDRINLRMTGTERPDPAAKTGPFDYRERLMLIQRVFVNGFDFDRGPGRNQLRAPTPTAVNGEFTPTTIFMRPGAVERWRVLNGSVDGRGFKNFMVLEGQFVFANNRLWRVVPGSGDEAPTFVAATRQDVADSKVGLYQLAFDGITLVSVENGQARYAIKDLATQNAGTTSPLDRETGPDPAPELLRNVEDCYRDGDSLRNTFVRPNEVFLANANRADVIFKAPVDATGNTYTIFAQEAVLTTDNYQARLQFGLAGAGPGFPVGNPPPVDVVVGYVRVSGDPVPGGDFDVMSLQDILPEVPPFLRPVTEDELRIPEAEAARRGVAAGSHRTRVVSYSGTGPTDLPVIEVPDDFANTNPDLEGRLWEEVNGARILLPPFNTTMAIHPDFDLAANPNPPSPRKFSHTPDGNHPKALVDTAEEWVLYNCSGPLWSHTDLERFPQPGSYLTHFRAYPMTRADGQARFAVDPEFRITTKGADHPFHIHINPCWVMRIEVPDEQGRLHNILPEPRWMDTVSIPRDGGRVVFRSRFADYVGEWINHCHLLGHEDQGMMQRVEAVARPEGANYRPRTSPSSATMSSEEVSAIYPPPSRELMYRQNLSFVDSHPLVGQVYPGFDFEVPKLEE